MEDKRLTMTILLDFYGDLLTEKQRTYFEMYHCEDLSLSEIAELEGISRQGVRDVLRRAEHTLMETEEKTGLIQRWNSRRSVVLGIERDLQSLLPRLDTAAQETVASVLHRLQDLKG